MRGHRKRWLLLGGGFGVGLGAVFASAFAVFVGTGFAAQNAKPQNTDPPSISGTAEVGKTLTGHKGEWDNSPQDFNYSWRRCSENGGSCSDISGAHALDYTLVSADAGNTLRFEVEATNSDGSTSATSVPTAVVSKASGGGSKPQNTDPPSISGTAQVGKTLTGDKGKWDNDPKDFNYFWMRCSKTGGSCSEIGGAHALKYTPVSGDTGNTLRFKVEAVNGAGSTFASSVPTAVVTASSGGGGSSGSSSTCTGSGTVNVKDISPPIRLLVDKWQFNPSVVNVGTRTIAARIHIVDTCNHAISGARVWATAIPYNQVSVEQATTGGDGYATLTFRVQSGFPANPGRQQIMAILVRATDPNGSALAGKSTRRVLRLAVNAR